MNFDSPSKMAQNIEQFFGTSDSPVSPCTLSKGLLKPNRAKRLAMFAPLAPLATRNLNTFANLAGATYDSPTSTLAADLDQNFHIAETHNQYAHHLKHAPSSTKMDSQRITRPTLDNNSSRSSRTGSNVSISSVCSLSSFSSVDSISSSSHLQPPFIPAPPQANNNNAIFRRSLRRSQTTSANSVRTIKSFRSMSSSDQITISQQLYEEESDNIGQQDGESALDKLCVPSPIMEKTLVLDDDTDEQDDSDFNKREIGSPIQKRPIRSKVRRIHSMFYSKKEITDTTNMFGNLMNSKSPNLDKIHNTDDDHEDGLSNSILRKSKIETFNVKNDSIPRISVSTLCKILDGCYQEFFDEVTVVDCRFEYEYKGGHIYNAVNVSSQRELEDKFLNTNLKKNNAFQSKKNKLIVFHCEFSSYRGPLMASHLRTCDRNINQDNYPHLDYPDILILEGGYKTFFDSQSHRCYPQKYVEMNDNNHKSLCERELNRFKRDLKKASSFNNLSFAASVNSASTINTKTTSTKIDRRTVTSGAINFTRRPSLKSQFLDMTRSTNDIGNISESDDENKPPESLNFAFKFPKRVETPSNQLDRNPSSAASKLFTLQPKEHNDTPIFRKKLSRSLTYNM